MGFMAFVIYELIFWLIAINVLAAGFPLAVAMPFLVLASIPLVVLGIWGISVLCNYFTRGSRSNDGSSEESTLLGEGGGAPITAAGVADATPAAVVARAAVGAADADAAADATTALTIGR